MVGRASSCDIPTLQFKAGSARGQSTSAGHIDAYAPSCGVEMCGGWRGLLSPSACLLLARTVADVPFCNGTDWNRSTSTLRVHPVGASRQGSAQPFLAPFSFLPTPATSYECDSRGQGFGEPDEPLLVVLALMSLDFAGIWSTTPRHVCQRLVARVDAQLAVPPRVLQLTKAHV